MSVRAWVTVFAGSAEPRSPQVKLEVAQFVADLARAGIGIVYGGGSVGLMGVVADAALAVGGEVIGVIPASLAEAEIAHPGLTRLHVVDTMARRKEVMLSLGDGVVALPGGVGTLDELFDAWAQLLLGHHCKPLLVVNTGGFWDPLLELADRLVNGGFLAPRERSALIPVETIADLVLATSSWTAPPPRWRSAPVLATSERLS